MKKIIFKVTNVWEYTNGKTGETFKKLQLIAEGEPVTKNGCAYTPKIVAYHTCQEHDGSSEFIFDDSYMANREEYIKEDGTKGTQLIIRLRAEL